MQLFFTFENLAFVRAIDSDPKLIALKCNELS